MGLWSLVPVREAEENLSCSLYSLCLDSPPSALNMVDAFCATWKLIDSQNFDDYMKALGKLRLMWAGNLKLCVDGAWM